MNRDGPVVTRHMNDRIAGARQRDKRDRQGTGCGCRERRSRDLFPVIAGQPAARRALDTGGDIDRAARRSRSIEDRYCEAAPRSFETEPGFMTGAASMVRAAGGTS